MHGEAIVLCFATSRKNMHRVLSTVVRTRRYGNLKPHLQGPKRRVSDEAKNRLEGVDKHSSQNEVSNTNVSIPGPTWLWTAVQPLAAPFRAYGRASKSHPYTTQLSSALVIYFLGDLSGQYIRQRGEHPQQPGQALVDNYDPRRSLRALCIGSISAIPGYHWFIYLSTHFNVPATWPLSRILSLGYKVVINQAFFTPIFNSYFFAMQCILSGDGGSEVFSSDATVWDALAVGDRLEAAWVRIKETVPTSWYNSCKFW